MIYYINKSNINNEGVYYYTDLDQMSDIGVSAGWHISGNDLTNALITKITYLPNKNIITINGGIINSEGYYYFTPFSAFPSDDDPYPEEPESNEYIHSGTFLGKTTDELISGIAIYSDSNGIKTIYCCTFTKTTTPINDIYGGIYSTTIPSVNTNDKTEYIFEKITNSPNKHFSKLTIDSNKNIYAVATTFNGIAGGLYKINNIGISNIFPQQTSLTKVSANSQRIIVTSIDSITRKGFIYTSIDGGINFNQYNSQNLHYTSTCIATTSNKAYASANDDSNGGLFRLVITSWENITPNDAGNNFSYITCNNSGSIVVACTGSSILEGFIYVNENSGQRDIWQRIIKDFSSYDNNMFNKWSSVTVNSSGTNIDASDFYGNFWKSSDLGNSWHVMNKISNNNMTTNLNNETNYYWNSSTNNLIMNSTHFWSSSYVYKNLKADDYDDVESNPYIDTEETGDVIAESSGDIIKVITIDNTPPPTPTPTPIPLPISDICFIAGTPIVTNQGIIPIEKINPKIHTIRNKKIIAITKTISQDDYLVCFEKNSLGPELPNKKTIMSKDHKLFYKGKIAEAKKFLGKFNKVTKITYNGEILYNVLMEDCYKINVNNLTCESLDPDNVIAKLYTEYNDEKCKNSLIIKMNESILKQDYPTYKNIVKSIVKS
uniref:Hedgehog/Intein (Hint) domain-containing protein n=1 Tax=viral metagenome TaxID=1070528 RepID=A0A6C0D950_9ZZZZ